MLKRMRRGGWRDVTTVLRQHLRKFWYGVSTAEDASISFNSTFRLRNLVVIIFAGRGREKSYPFLWRGISALQ